MQPGDLEALAAQLNKQDQARGQATFEFKSIPQGAATSVWAGVVASADEVGGHYCEDCHTAALTSAGMMDLSAGVRPYALDAERAKALWAKSEDMVGEKF